MKNKKIILTLMVIVLVIVAVVIVITKSSEEKQIYALNNYIALINNHRYEELYQKISEESKSKISQEDFVKRNKNIYEGIDTVEISVNINKIEKKNGKIAITYNENMPVSAGTIEFTNTAYLIKENGEYKIDWSSNLIFPDLSETAKVRVETIKAKRGEIIDRNNQKLAENGSALQIGIVPGKIEDKEETINKVSELTGVSKEFIDKEISAEYVEDDMFIPIKKISQTETELENSLLEIPGVQVNTIDSRVYPQGKECANLVGYISSINEEELKKNEGKGYSSKSLIGKVGLEYAYEDTLKATDGKEIYIEDENGNKIKELAKIDGKDGTDVKLTIDSSLQSKIYKQMEKEKGLFVVMNPSTGEILSAVSTPSYDNNKFVLGISNEEWEEINNNEDKPLINKITQSYCPGSTFKPLTAAIGLSSGKITTSTTFDYEGLSWQKDSSWGNDNITTLTSYSAPKNIANALLYSDNIFFGRAAMEIGANEFCKGLDNLGFNKEIDFPLALKKSQYSSSTTIENEKKLADSGYGQGDVLVNPIHMASIYSAFSNEGNMIKPYITYKEDNSPEYLKQNVFSVDIANEIKEDLKQVVENPKGTANDMKMKNHTIAGKTGTAELKTSADDTESGTLGWFDCFTIGEESGTDMLIVSMVENEQGNIQGGSHKLIAKIKTLF